MAGERPRLRPFSRGAAPTRGAGAPPRSALGAVLAGADRGEFPPSLYLEGPSEPLKAAILWDLRHAWGAAVPDAAPARVLRTAETGVEEILALHQGGSLFDARELVLVLEIEDLGRSDKRVAALAEGLAHPGGSACLVLVESEGDSPRKTLEPLRAACAARVVALPPSRAELLAWGLRRLKHEKIGAEPGAVEAIADACEGDALAFFSELSRLTGFAGAGGTLTRRDGEELLRPAVGSALPDYLAAISAGDATLASRRLGRLLAAGESEGSILFALSNLVGGALGGWSRHRDLSAALRSRRTPVQLMRAMDALYRAESAWKGGRADAVAVLEQATRMVAAG
jgi:DNA polymerase III delta subunit